MQSLQHTEIFRVRLLTRHHDLLERLPDVAPLLLLRRNPASFEPKNDMTTPTFATRARILISIWAPPFNILADLLFQILCQRFFDPHTRGRDALVCQLLCLPFSRESRTTLQVKIQKFGVFRSKKVVVTDKNFRPGPTQIYIALSI